MKGRGDGADGRVVVVGAGQAAVILVEELRRSGHRGPITVVGEEADLPYERPPLSKEYLTGARGQADLELRPAGFYAGNGVDLLLGRRVAVLDRAERVAVLDDGSGLPYGHLVLATGSRPRTLPVPGADLPGVLSLRTRADADELRGRLDTASRVVLAGAGFVGLEVAAGLCAAGRKPVVIDVADRVMGRSVSPCVSAYAAVRHRDAGARLLLGTGIRRLLPGDGGTAAAVGAIETSGGETIPADLVVVGVGVVARDELAREAGLPVDNGVLVDEFLSTPDPAISAIGDCASFPLDGGDRRARLESVQTAGDQARCVAARLTGAPRAYRKVPWFFSHQGPIRLQLAGLPDAGAEVVVRGDPDTGRFSTFHYRGAVLTGVESINDPATHMAARLLLGAGTSPPRDLVAAPSTNLRAIAMSAAER